MPPILSETYLLCTYHFRGVQCCRRLGAFSVSKQCFQCRTVFAKILLYCRILPRHNFQVNFNNIYTISTLPHMPAWPRHENLFLVDILCPKCTQCHITLPLLCRGIVFRQIFCSAAYDLFWPRRGYVLISICSGAAGPYDMVHCTLLHIIWLQCSCPLDHIIWYYVT